MPKAAAIGGCIGGRGDGAEDGTAILDIISGGMGEKVGGEDGASVVLSSILPPPPAVQHWQTTDTADDATGKPKSGLAATEWLVNAVQHAHLSPMIKKAGRDLMACEYFTANLAYFKCWDQVLKPKLKAALVVLGEEAKLANAACNLAALLTQDAILANAPFNAALVPVDSTEAAAAAAAAALAAAAHTESNVGEGGDGGDQDTPAANPHFPTNRHHTPPRNAVRQDLLMPSLVAAVSADYERDWKQQPEHVYIHILLLLGTAVDPLFGEALNALVSDLEGVEVHAAPIKSFLRMMNKLRSKKDHQQVELQPRPAMNIDVVRRLAAASTGEGVLELTRLVAARFGGLSHLKCLPELAATDPAAADARFHMLPVMLTVAFEPAGITVGSLRNDPTVRAQWAALRAVRPGWAVSLEQWQIDHDRAVASFERCDPNEPVRMHCEVQVVTKAMAAVRRKMHEIYKVYRAENEKQLHSDVAKPNAEPVNEADLIEASKHGRIVTVKRLLNMVGMIKDGSDEGVNVNRQAEGGGRTALYWAATGGHLPVVAVLLERANADPNIARIDTGMTPLFVAAMLGHVDVVAKFLEHGTTDPNQAMTTDGTTPLLMAANNGHVNVVAKLLEHSATDPNQAKTDNGATPLIIIAYRDHVDIAAKLLEHSATDPNQAMTDGYGTTPLHVAAQKGRVGVVAKLLEHSSTDPNQAKTDKYGSTPLCMAANKGHADVVSKLLEHCATDPNQALTTDGSTPLCMAANKGHVDVVATLLEHGATDPNQPMATDGSTPLYWAAHKGHVDVVAKLVEHGSTDANQATLDEHGYTPLIAAAKAGHTKVVLLLLAANANVAISSTGVCKRTPLSMATDEGHPAIVDALRAAGATA